MAGYSSTPLWKKLGLKPGVTAAISRAPAGWAVTDAPAGIEWLPVDTDAPAALLLSFHTEPATFVADLPGLAERIRPAGMIWIAWPRKAAGHTSDMTENLIRDEALAIGLVDVKVAALDDDWSGLKLVWRRERR